MVKLFSTLTNSQISAKSTSVIEIIKDLKSREPSDESIKPPNTRGNSLAIKLKWIHNSKIAVVFKGNCLKREKKKLLLIEMW